MGDRPDTSPVLIMGGVQWGCRDAETLSQNGASGGCMTRGGRKPGSAEAGRAEGRAGGQVKVRRNLPL